MSTENKITRESLIDKLAQCYTDSADMYDILALYYDKQYDYFKDMVKYNIDDALDEAIENGIMNAGSTVEDLEEDV